MLPIHQSPGGPDCRVSHPPSPVRAAQALGSWLDPDRHSRLRTDPVLKVLKPARRPASQGAYRPRPFLKQRPAHAEASLVRDKLVTMHTFFGTLGAGEHRRWRRRSSTVAPSPSLRGFLQAEDGFLLIELLVSALLIALIVTATFSGFDVANRLSADERHHNVAAVLAAQSQEQLRSDSATTLDAIESKPHSYVREIPSGGTKYTITQEAHPINASGESTGCNATETSTQSGANIQIVSTVTWPQLTASKRPAVKQASIITPPVGSALEVDVTNGQTPPAGVPEVTAIARFTPVEAGAQTTAEGTTGPTGCVVLTGLAATSAVVEIVEKPGFVTPNGELKPEPKEVTITPNLTTHYEVTYYEAGKIQAEYTYNKLTSFEGKTVMGDTFTVFNSGILKAPQYEIGSVDKGLEYSLSGEEPYKAITTGKYSTVAATPAGRRGGAGLRQRLALAERQFVEPADLQVLRAIEAGDGAIALEHRSPVPADAAQPSSSV